MSRARRQSLPDDGQTRRYAPHDLCTIAVEADVHGREVIHETFDWCHLDPASIETSQPRLAIVRGVEDAAARAEVDLGTGRRGPGFRSGDNWFMTEKHPLFVASVEGSLVVGSSGNVDRHLLMFLDWMILASDTCLVHAAAVEHDGVGTLISGWGGTGKTATLARLCQREGASFVADDMVFVTRSGHALALPKPMYIYPYHRPLFPYLFEADHKPLVPKALTPQVERMRRAARPLVAAYPPLENWARKHTPEHMKTAPATAMPGLRIANTVPVAQVIRLSRGLGTEPVVRSVDPDSVVEGLVHELFHELIDVTGPMAAVAATSGGVMSLRHWLTERQSVISDHLEKTRVIQIDLPVHADATYTAELVSRVVFDPPPDGRDK